jgi:hypothetical protein
MNQSGAALTQALRTIDEAERRRLHGLDGAPGHFVRCKYCLHSHPISLPECPEEALDTPAVGVALCFDSCLLLNCTPLEPHGI